jgi:hypothetical protein
MIHLTQSPMPAAQIIGAAKGVGSLFMIRGYDGGSLIYLQTLVPGQWRAAKRFLCSKF